MHQIILTVLLHLITRVQIQDRVLTTLAVHNPTHIAYLAYLLVRAILYLRFTHYPTSCASHNKWQNIERWQGTCIVRCTGQAMCMGLGATCFRSWVCICGFSIKNVIISTTARKHFTMNIMAVRRHLFHTECRLPHSPRNTVTSGKQLCHALTMVVGILPTTI